VHFYARKRFLYLDQSVEVARLSTRRKLVHLETKLNRLASSKIKLLPVSLDNSSPPLKISRP
jgi:hypothetical protein